MLQWTNFSTHFPLIYLNLFWKKLHIPSFLFVKKKPHLENVYLFLHDYIKISQFNKHTIARHGHNVFLKTLFSEKLTFSLMSVLKKRKLTIITITIIIAKYSSLSLLQMKNTLRRQNLHRHIYSLKKSNSHNATQGVFVSFGKN